MTSGTIGNSTGSRQSLFTLATALAPCSPFAAPFEGCGLAIPSLGGRLEQSNDVLGCCRVLAVQCSSHHDALNGFSHVQPGASQRCIERHDAVIKQP